MRKVAPCAARLPEAGLRVSAESDHEMATFLRGIALGSNPPRKRLAPHTEAPAEH